MTEADLKSVKNHYESHRYDEPFLREYEPSFLFRSTPMNSWEQVKRDGMLKSWNILKNEKLVTEDQPVGLEFGDSADFSDYIMFGDGVAGEIIVNSKQQRKIVMDTDARYLTGARLYFDARKTVQDGLLIRGGCHLKVKDMLPLKPCLIWTATWETIGLAGRVPTP